MNLQEFIAYRECCPICDNKLITSFHSEKKQTIRFEDNRLLVVFWLNALKKHQINYKVGYSFSLTDNSWYAEFYNKDDKRFELDSPEFLRARFKELDKNLGGYKFYRHCTSCRRYNYSTNTFQLDFQSGIINKLCLNMEYIGLSTPSDDGYKVYRLLNDYMSSKSILMYGKHQTEEHIQYNSHISSQPLRLLETNSVIKFSSPIETVDKLNKIILFS